MVVVVSLPLFKVIYAHFSLQKGDNENRPSSSSSHRRYGWFALSYACHACDGQKNLRCFCHTTTFLRVSGSRCVVVRNNARTVREQFNGLPAGPRKLPFPSTRRCSALLPCDLSAWRLATGVFSPHFLTTFNSKPKVFVRPGQ